MTISKDIWSQIFKHLKINDFMNVMLVEKSAYNGFKLSQSPTFIANQQSYDEESNGESNGRYFITDPCFCQLCDNYVNEDEIFINNQEPFHSVDLSSPCCKNILCPKCVTIIDKKIIFHYLFIRKLIYIQPDEDNCDEECYHEDIQYRWVPCKKQWNYEKQSQINKKYNMYTTDKINQYFDIDIEDDCISEDVDYTDIYANCVCRNCGFECGVRNYMDS